jgi:molybdate transport system substrate-binding protein
MRLKALVVGCALSLFALRAEAAQVQVAVAANFTEPVKEIAALFKQKTGNDLLLSFGASGVFYTQITHGAPFEILLSADEERAKMAVENGFGVAGSRFTYAIGKLVLWSKVIDVTKGDEALRNGAFSKLSIANPKSAPYGTAAIETMKALGVYDKLEPKIVQGTSIAQAFQFVDTKNAEAGFVALSQLYAIKEGTRWIVPAQLYAPIRQDAVLLKPGEHDEAAKAFLAFLKSPEARAIVERFGYALP